MRTTACIAMALLLGLAATAQPQRPDSLKALIAAEKTDSIKGRHLIELGAIYIATEPDTALKIIYQAWQLADRSGNTRLQVVCKRLAGYLVGQTGNYVKGLQLMLSAKELAEKNDDSMEIAFCYHEIANVYKWQRDFKNAAFYYNKVKQYYQPDYTTFMNLGIVYLELNKIDSALAFASTAYQTCIAGEDQTYLSTILANLGRIHLRLGNVPLGRNYLLMAENMAKQKKHRRSLGFVYLDISRFFLEAKLADSAIHYYKNLLQIKGIDQFKPLMLEASTNLSDLYTFRNTDSAFKYLKLATGLKEDMLSAEKAQEIMTMRYEDELRQQQMNIEKQQQATERKHNLQYAAIAFTLVSFIILFFLFSHSIIANQKVIRFLGVIALLIVFEFLNLLLHPWLGAVTHHSPVLMLLAMVCVAALLIPLHHRLEHWITHRLVEKNKKIRVAAAKKIIAQLEPEKAN